MDHRRRRWRRARRKKIVQMNIFYRKPSLIENTNK